MAEVLRTHDFAQVFGFLRARGWSMAAIAAAVGLTETRIRAICAGKQRVTSYEVIERIALGLGIDRGLLGLVYTEANYPDSVAADHETTSETAQAEESLIMNIGDESAHHGRQAGHSNIADRQLDELDEAVDR